MSAHLCRCMRIISLSCTLVFAAVAGSGADKMSSVRITTISAYTPARGGQGEILRYLTRWFESRGVKIDQHAEWSVWFTSVPLDESDSTRIVLAIGIAHALPKEAIDLGKSSEVFYSSLPASTKASLPREGKWIREYVTGEFLHEFIYPLDEKLVVVHKEELLHRLDELMKELCGRQLEG